MALVSRSMGILYQHHISTARCCISLSFQHLYMRIPNQRQGCCSGDARVGRPGQPVALKTPLGWTVLGKLKNDGFEGKSTGMFHLRDEEDEELHQLVKSYFTTEPLAPSQQLLSPDQEMI